ncbi:hypothetical protein MSG28_009284 [Choristoneura fumiferana]|uniref:Uncharacterized protein n=1 Tax=Choristoneura fumiferana TaxID=7141 RepID=A0ACC0KWR1_CHOFU|nr:hypothetical protein MSG28_009284 [Choristoneura fumiferana]
MLRSLTEGAWLTAYTADFRRRFSRLLGRSLRKLPASLALPTLVNDSVSLKKLAMGFQMKEPDDIASELGLPGSQILAKFYEACKKINASFNTVLEQSVAKEIGIEDMSAEVDTNGPVKQSLNEELTKAAKELERKQRKELSKLMGEDLAQYRIKGSDQDWGQALAATKAKALVSVKSGEKRLGDDSKELDDLLERDNTKKKKRKHNRKDV